MDAGGRQYAAPRVLRQPNGCGKELRMDAGKAVELFENKVLDAVNKSGLHPVVVRLALLNIVHAVEEKEREIAKAAEAAETKKEDADG